MKNTLLLLLFLLSLGCKTKHKEKKINGPFALTIKITGKHIPVLWLQYPDSNGKIIEQKSIIKNNTAIFKGYLSSPVGAQFHIVSLSATYNNFVTQTFLSPGNMTALMDGSSLTVYKLTGSDMQDDWDRLQKLQIHLIKRRDSLMKRIGEIQSAKSAKYDEEVNVILLQLNRNLSEQNQIDYKFIAQSPNSHLSAYLTRFFFVSRTLNLDTAERFYNSFNPAVKKSLAARWLQKEIDVRKASYTGSMAPSFTKINSKGDVIDLKSFRNKKYVILDFWEGDDDDVVNLDLPRIFEKYHHDLDIISISSANYVGSLKNDIVKYKKTKWHHVLDTASDLSHKYDLSAPPNFFILIDKNGRIMGRYIQGAYQGYTNGDNEGTMADLQKKLQQTFGF